ncbi:MAG: sigma-70 family RNA polymerase sigma factor [Polyangiaceae bacterium]
MDLYLKELTASKPLTREQELTLARRIADAEHAAFEAVCQLGTPLLEIIQLADSLVSGALDAREIFEGDEAPPTAELVTVAALERRCRDIDADLRRGSGDARALRAERTKNRNERNEKLPRLRLGRDQRRALVGRVGRLLERFAEVDAVARLSGEARSEHEKRRRSHARNERRRIARRLGAPLAQIRRSQTALRAALANVAKSKRELTTANLRLVIAFAKKYAGHGVALGDLVQEGNLGLLRAVDKFDHRAGTKFSTYASWWLRQSMQRAIVYQGRSVRLPVHVAAARATLARTSQRLAQQLGRPPQVEELAEAMAASPDRIRATLDAARLELSMDTPLGEDENLRLGDTVPHGGDDPEVETRRGEDQRHAEEVLTTLNAREQRVIRLRFGIGVSRAHTLREIGEQLGLTRERIRQIEANALAKMRRVATTSIR